MNCPKCGAPMLIRLTQKASAVSEAMNEQRRARHCKNWHVTDTVEVTRAELQSLRTMAYMKGASA